MHLLYMQALALNAHTKRPEVMSGLFLNLKCKRLHFTYSEEHIV